MSFSYLETELFQNQLNRLRLVHEAFMQLRSYGFLAYVGDDSPSEEPSGCRFSLESELDFLLMRSSLKVEFFSPEPHITIWIIRTLMSILSNLGIMETFANGPCQGCCAIDRESFVEIN